jgi:hypothetical protein
MSPSHGEIAPLHVVAQPLRRYHRLLAETAKLLERDRIAAGGPWSPPFDLPDPADARWSELLQSTPLRFGRIGGYRGHMFDAIDLTGNPGTRTTKSLASMTMVARAILHARSSGRPLTIVTPTSGNKGTALRDAVARAQNSGIPGAELVRIVMLVPAASASKLRKCVNDSDPEFSVRNPIATVDVETGAELKELAAMATEEVRMRTAGRRGDHWYSLALDNYRFADAMRAFLEHEVMVTGGLEAPTESRLHVQSVSSAFGLLGYQLGRDILDRDLEFADQPLPPASYFLVQHLGAPDMILHLRQDSGAAAPEYIHEHEGNGFRQHVDPSFPYVTDDPNEILDPTFYTRNPPTAVAMTDLIRRQGGGGIVVSKRECISRFTEIRDLFGNWLPLPEDPHMLREWSLLMAACGILNAIDRDTVRTDRIVVHATGSYWDAILPSYQADRVVRLHDAGELITLLELQ